MSTDRQIEANALGSGIHAESTIITGEDPDVLAQLAKTFYHDHQPQTAMERALLDNIIRDTWLLTRFSRIDAEIIDYEIEDGNDRKGINPAGKAFRANSTGQTRLQRRINGTRRSQIQAIQDFQRLQAERRAQPPPPQSQPLEVTSPPSTWSLN